MKRWPVDFRKLVSFFEKNKDILHLSKYHLEGFETHCLLVIGLMMEQYEAGAVSEEALIAACLHDIAKPRTAALNKRNEACFYGHEKVTDEELTEFLDHRYAGFEKVAALVRGHMLPLGIGESTPEPLRTKNKDRLNDFVRRYGHDDKQFKDDLIILSDCDIRASVKSEDELPAAELRASFVRDRLLQISD